MRRFSRAQCSRLTLVKGERPVCMICTLYTEHRGQRPTINNVIKLGHLSRKRKKGRLLIVWAVVSKQKNVFQQTHIPRNKGDFIAVQANFSSNEMKEISLSIAGLVTIGQTPTFLGQTAFVPKSTRFSESVPIPPEKMIPPSWLNTKNGLPSGEMNLISFGVP